MIPPSEIRDNSGAVTGSLMDSRATGVHSETLEACYNDASRPYAQYRITELSSDANCKSWQFGNSSYCICLFSFCDAGLAASVGVVRSHRWDCSIGVAVSRQCDLRDRPAGRRAKFDR